MTTIKFYDPNKKMGKQNNKWPLWSIDDLTLKRWLPSVPFPNHHWLIALAVVREKCFTQDHNTMTQAGNWTRTARSGVQRANHWITAHTMTEREVIFTCNDFSETVWTLDSRWRKLSNMKYYTCWKNVTSTHTRQTNKKKEVRRHLHGRIFA